MITRLLDWRLRGVLRKSGLPDLPEVRRTMRLSYLNGFTFGALQHRADEAHAVALEAMARHEEPQEPYRPMVFRRHNNWVQGGP